MANNIVRVTPQLHQFRLHLLQSPVDTPGQTLQVLFRRPPFFASRFRWIEARTCERLRDKAAPGYASDYNVFLGGARKSTFGDEHSTAAPAAADVTRKEIPLGVTIEWSIPTPVFAIGPWVDDKLVGVLPTAGQTIEARNGKPIRVDTDALGARRERPTPGPLAEFKPGRHRIEWTWKRQG